MTIPEPNNHLSCLRCRGTMVTEPRSLPHRLRSWFVDGQALRGQVYLRCANCGEGATSSPQLSAVRQLPVLLAFAQRIRDRRALFPTPLFHCGAAAAGVAAGLLARRAGAPRWTPAAGAVTSTLAAGVWVSASALEPGARWRSLIEAWQEAHDPQELDRSTVRRIRQAPFPFVGVTGWQGTQRVGGHGIDGDFALSSVVL
jgi:hypothetical protein